MKKNLLTMMLVFSLILLVGCNNNKQENVITFSWWGGEDRHVATLKVIEDFETKYPDYRVQPQYTSWDGYYTQLSTQLICNRAPDVMQVNYNWFYLFGGDRRFMDLKELNIDLEKWPKSELDPITIDDKVLGLSISETGRNFYFNKNVYDDAKVKIPTTWDELIEAGKVINGKNNKQYALGKLGSQTIAIMMFSYLSQKYGKNVIVDDKLAFTKEELLDGFSFFQRLRDNGVLLPTTKLDSEDGPTNPNWIEGRYGGIFEWNTSIGTYESTLPPSTTLVTAGMLSLDNQKSTGMYKKTSMAFAVNKDSTDKKEIIETFINYLFSDEYAVTTLGLERGVTSHSDGYKVLESNNLLKGLEWEGHGFVQDLYNESLENDVDLYIHPYYEDDTFRKVYEQEIEAWLLGDKVASQAVDNIIRNFNTALASAMSR